MPEIFSREYFQQYGAKGGRKRWRNIPKDQRISIMSKMGKESVRKMRMRYGKDIFRKIGQLSIAKLSKEQRINLGHLGERSRSLTAQERRIKWRLNQYRLPCEMKCRVDTNKKSMNIDFVIPNSKDPKVFIEATSLVHQDKFYLNIMNLSERSFELKKLFPKCLSVVVISEKLPTEGIIKLNESFDSVYFDSEIKQLVSDIRKYLKTNRKIEHKVSVKTNYAFTKRKPTNQEFKIKDFLDRNQVNYEFQKWLESKVKRRCVDFFIKGKINCVVEATSARSNNEKSIKKSLIRLVNKLLMIKTFYLKGVMCIGILECQHGKVNITSRIKNFLQNEYNIKIFMDFKDFENFLLNEII
ncbi:MAG: hypothetical protein J4452_04425 [Candidatus Aenigmarchaeota archaeon]|nr:hypothetical protein [Candidatus Aenigmarchaeota archaeon]